jgi:hypothetical protein
MALILIYESRRSSDGQEKFGFGQVTDSPVFQALRRRCEDPSFGDTVSGLATIRPESVLVISLARFLHRFREAAHHVTWAGPYLGRSGMRMSQAA